MPRTLKLTVSYAGTRYVGWQRQAEGTSIQGLLEEALARFEGAPVTVHGAGRTDAGVHAIGQIATAVVSCAHAVSSLQRGLNAMLPPDVRVTAVEEAPVDFHARFSARSKTYCYAIRNAPLAGPFEWPFVWHVPEALDLPAMQQAAAALIGTYDFAAFGSAGSGTHTTTRTITRSEIFITDDVGRALSGWPGGPDRVRPTIVGTSGLLLYEVTGTGFLRHMVRAIVGTLVETGRGQRASGTIEALLHGGVRADAGATAPPQGLFLVRVDYH
ncbi:MAG: tRNA pseudouridine(38-40) synthase TruA [Acidobacteria bacterium RIFCSPLOWO2_12_FULL_67_14]|nr:MAG: tRNA pseudouridine(38-40) synthase TruA [Acidobacteria bacterium RIFCSPLOWO2_02_FULL_67_21]OFW36840.1 MAG: tRNA pseudouridine(38-40) synthase TruA [Acidobacteria bacterium RIFCSPLOWO2_12_FULL_67_14]